MKENGNEQKAVWTYAVVLFFSAFIVLLLTAYGQIKLNKNIDEYEDQIHNEKQQNINFRMDLATMVEKNEQLKKEIEALKKDISALEEQNAISAGNIKDMEDKHSETVEMYEKLILAINEYEKGNTIECALILYSQVDTNKLDAKGREKYLSLVGSTFKPASHQLYRQGYQHYLEKDYANAISKFRKSLELSANEYISDDCIYFIAYSEYRLGNYDKAREAVNELMDRFPDSNYRDDAADLLKLIDN